MSQIAVQSNMSAPVKRILIIIGLVVVGFALLPISGGGVFKFSGDLVNLIAVVGGVLAILQIVNNSIDGMRTESDRRDRFHDQQISDLKTRLEAIATQLIEHQSALGHTGSLEQILQIKDQVSDLRAALAVSTRQGEVFLKLDRLEKEIERLNRHRELAD